MQIKSGKFLWYRPQSACRMRSPNGRKSSQSARISTCAQLPANLRVSKKNRMEKKKQKERNIGFWQNFANNTGGPRIVWTLTKKVERLGKAEFEKVQSEWGKLQRPISYVTFLTSAAYLFFRLSCREEQKANIPNPICCYQGEKQQRRMDMDNSSAESLKSRNLTRSSQQFWETREHPTFANRKPTMAVCIGICHLTPSQLQKMLNIRSSI